MGDTNLYTVTPYGWDIEKSFLIAKKIVSQSSNGSVYVGYEVVKRVSFNGYERKMSITNSLKGVYYNQSELNTIRPYKCEDTSQDIICNRCCDCDWGFELTHNFH